MAKIGTDILIASNELNQGHLVAIPTETVYGLAGNAFNELAVAKIFAVKKRPSFDPLIVHLPAGDYLDNVVSEIPAIAKKLSVHFWPGPLTLVLPRKTRIPDLVTSGLPTVAVRVPNHPLTLELLRTLSFPLACPSANPFGYVSPTTAHHVEAQLGEDIPYILDGGSCQIGIESTILGFDGEQPILYRPGGIPVEDIENVAGRVTIKTTGTNPVAPGMLKNHYSPNKTLKIGNISELLKKYGHQRVGVLSFEKRYDELSDLHQIQLSPKGDLTEAAHNLFASLRKLDAMDIRYIFAELVPETGLGTAINDRLKRAGGG